MTIIELVGYTKETSNKFAESLAAALRSKVDDLLIRKLDRDDSHVVLDSLLNETSYVLIHSTPNPEKLDLILHCLRGYRPKVRVGVAMLCAKTT